MQAPQFERLSALPCKCRSHLKDCCTLLQTDCMDLLTPSKPILTYPGSFISFCGATT
jgi:hypothetical protein